MIDGIFAAGDIRHDSKKQAAEAASDGTKAALSRKIPERAVICPYIGFPGISTGVGNL